MISTSYGALPAVSDCHGASQYVIKLLIVGAGVMSAVTFTTVGVGVSSAKPHSLENVISWSHSETVILDARPVRVVAQIVFVMVE